MGPSVRLWWKKRGRKDEWVSVTAAIFSENLTPETGAQTHADRQN
jgi:hypothetical protein